MTEVFSLETLLNDIQLLKFQVEQLKDENKKIPHLEAEIVNLKKENEHLKERLLKYEPEKTNDVFNFCNKTPVFPSLFFN